MMTDKVEIRESTLEDIEYISKNMRLADRKEIFAFGGYKPKEALLLGLENGHACTLVYNGEPSIMFGVTSEHNLTRSGQPWMLSVKAMNVPPITILKTSKHVVDQMKQMYYYLENYVDARNDVSINWLKWLGFKFDEPIPMGKYGVLFHRFFWNKSVDK